MATRNDMEIREKISDQMLRCQLLDVVAKDDKECLESLLRDNPDYWDITDKYKASLLHLAASHGSQRCLLYLLAAGRKVLVTDESGCHPLHYAAGNGHLEAVHCLLQHGADISAKNEEGELPLMLACLAGNMDIASLLLEKHHEAQNPEMGFRDSSQNTVLHYAMIGNHQMVKHLLEKLSQLGNNKVVLNQIANSVNKANQTILQVATEQSHYDIVETGLKQLQITVGKNIGIAKSENASVVALADANLKMPSAATRQMQKHNVTARYRQNSPDPLLLEAATPDYLNTSENPDFLRMDSKVTPITDGIIPIEDLVSGSLIKKALLHKYHSVTVHPFMIEELTPEERQSYLGVHRPTDTGRMLELLCGLHGLVVERLALNHHLVSTLVMVKCDRDNPLKIKVTIPHAWALKTATDRPASGEIQVFTVSTAGEIPVPLPQHKYDTDSSNCVITTVIRKQQIFAVTVQGEFLTLNKKPLPHIKPPGIRCIYHVLLSEPVECNDCITAEVLCGIDLPTTRKMLTEKRKSQPDAEGTFVLSHDHIDMSYRITKGHGWRILDREHKASASSILPSSNSEIYGYLLSRKFTIFPFQTKKASNQVECQLLIAAGTVKLVQERFTHTHPNQYPVDHQISASSSVDHLSSLRVTPSGTLTRNGDVPHTSTQSGAQQATQNSSIEDSTKSNTFTVQITKGGESGETLEGRTVV